MSEYYTKLALALIAQFREYDSTHGTQYRAAFDENYHQGRDVVALAECLSNVVDQPAQKKEQEKEQVQIRSSKEKNE